MGWNPRLRDAINPVSTAATMWWCRSWVRRGWRAARRAPVRPVDRSGPRVRRAATEEGVLALGRVVRSPGGWVVPRGRLAGWNWLPDAVTTIWQASDRLPWWLRSWQRLPLVGRSAAPWMWRHGRFLLQIPGPRPGGGGTAGDRAPLPDPWPRLTDRAAVLPE